MPAIDLRLLPDLVGIAFALTIVALGQSISIAKAVAARSGQHIDANREFRGQGLSNIVGGLFSSYVSCGSLNRSLPNLDAGARTPLAAVFASLWLLLLAAVSAPLLALIPMAAIAALLLLIAWSLFDLAGWRQLWRFSRQDFAVAAATFAATVSIRLEVAILLGTILSLVTFLYRTSKPAIRIMGFDGTAPARPFVVRSDVPEPLPECPQVKMIRMEGEVYFGAVSHVSDLLRDLRAPANSPKHLLVMSKSMNFIDLAAADMWRAEMMTRRSAGGDLYFHRPRAPVLELWQRPAFWPSSAPTTSSRPSGSRSRRSSTGSTAASAPTARSASSRSARGLPLPVDGAASEASPGSYARRPIVLKRAAARSSSFEGDGVGGDASHRCRLTRSKETVMQEDPQRGRARGDALTRHPSGEGCSAGDGGFAAAFALYFAGGSLRPAPRGEQDDESNNRGARRGVDDAGVLPARPGPGGRRRPAPARPAADASRRATTAASPSRSAPTASSTGAIPSSASSA